MKKIKQENSKEKILQSATKLFARNGFDGTSVRDICKDAGVNVCMISYYWGGKQELYNGIIEDLIEKQVSYGKTFLDLELDFYSLSKKEQIDLFMLILDKFVDFFYSNVSKDLIVILLNEQQKADFAPNSIVLSYIRRLIACILDKDEQDRECIFKTLFIFSQVNSPRILPAFSLRLLGQDDFTQEDIKIIKENVKFYANAMFKEANIV